MQPKRLKVLAAATVGAVALLVAALYLKPGATVNSQTLTAVINMPMTGALSFPSKSFQDGVTLATDDLKAANTEVRFKLDWEDNMSNPATAATLSQAQYASKGDIFYVGYGAELEAALPVLAEAGKPIFAFAFQASLTKHPLVFRNIVSYKNEAPIFVNYAVQRKSKKIAAIFHDLPDAHEQFRQLVLPGMVRSGIPESAVSLYPYSLNSPDFRTLVAKVKTTKPDLIIVSGFQSNLVPLVEALKTAQMIDNGNVIGTFSILDLLTLTKGEALEGVAAAMPNFMLRPSARAADFQKRFAARFGRAASFNEFCGYDFALLMNDLSKRLPPHPPGDQLVKAVQDTRLNGVSGDMRFDEEGDIIYPTEAAIFRGGKLVPVADASTAAHP